MPVVAITTSDLSGRSFKPNNTFRGSLFPQDERDFDLSSRLQNQEPQPVSLKTRRSIYPLHLTPFESYMFVDDSVRHPMTFVVEFEFGGDMNRDKFQSAIHQAIRRHPMLRSLIRKAKANRDCWIAATNYNSEVTWLDFDQPWNVDGTGEYINLREEIGFRCIVRKDASRALATFIFHHSCCDGIGAYQFIGDVLWFYADAHGAAQPELPELDELELRKRMRANISYELVEQAKSTPPIEHQIVTPIATVSPEQDRSGSEFAFPSFTTKTYDKTEFRDLRLRAQQAGQTPNSRLLQALLIAIASWNLEHQPDATAEDLFAINMPMDLRQQDQPIFSGINLVTSGFVVRSAAQISDTASLEHSLNEEIVRLKHTRFHSHFMKMLLQWPLSLEESRDQYDPEQCHSSVVFSNTGDPTKRFLVELPRHQGKIHCGNLVLEDINGTPPLRMETRASISIFTYRRQLRLCMRMDPRYFSNTEAQQFLDHFAGRFEKGW